jgi:hypothetical protein
LFASAEQEGERRSQTGEGVGGEEKASAGNSQLNIVSLQEIK